MAQSENGHMAKKPACRKVTLRVWYPLPPFRPMDGKRTFRPRSALPEWQTDLQEDGVCRRVESRNDA